MAFEEQPRRHKDHEGAQRKARDAMLNPFLLMAVFYLIVAIVAAVDAALTSFTLLPWFVGLPWLRVHFITLGVFSEAAFGVLPAFVAARRGTETPATRTRSRTGTRSTSAAAACSRAPAGTRRSRR